MVILKKLLKYLWYLFVGIIFVITLFIAFCFACATAEPRRRTVWW